MHRHIHELVVQYIEALHFQIVQTLMNTFPRDLTKIGPFLSEIRYGEDEVPRRKLVAYGVAINIICGTPSTPVLRYYNSGGTKIREIRENIWNWKSEKNKPGTPYSQSVPVPGIPVILAVYVIHTTTPFPATPHMTYIVWT